MATGFKVALNMAVRTRALLRCSQVMGILEFIPCYGGQVVSPFPTSNSPYRLIPAFERGSSREDRVLTARKEATTSDAHVRSGIKSASNKNS